MLAAVLGVCAVTMYRVYYGFPPAHRLVFDQALAGALLDPSPGHTTTEVCHPLAIDALNASGDTTCSLGSARASYTVSYPVSSSADAAGVYARLIDGLPGEHQGAHVGSPTEATGYYTEAFTAPVAWADGTRAELSCGYLADADPAAETDVWCDVTEDLAG